MTPNQDLNARIESVGINWQEANEDPATKKVTLKGTFENNGKQYVVTITYNSQTLKSQLDDAAYQAINENITKSLDEIGHESLAKLSGHTLRTSYDDLKNRRIHVLGKDEQEIADWQNLPLSQVVSNVKKIFSNVFKLKDLPEDTPTNRAAEINVEEQPNREQSEEPQSN